MPLLECCGCGIKASRMVNGKYYCGDCVEIIDYIQEIHKSTETRRAEEEPKKSGFWRTLGKWIAKSGGCGCGGGCC